MNGAGVAVYPSALTRALDGFSIGSNRSGTEQARGQFDDLETFNYPLTDAQMAERPDTDSDGLPDGWETLYGLDPYNTSGNNGANGCIDCQGGNNGKITDIEGGTTMRELQFALRLTF